MEPPDHGDAVTGPPRGLAGRFGAAVRRPAVSASASVPSPCTSVCRMSPSTGWCEGCLRSIDEIAAWAALSDADKLVIWDRLDERRERIEMDGSR